MMRDPEGLYPHPCKLSQHQIVERLYEIANRDNSPVAHALAKRLEHGHMDTIECLLWAVDLLSAQNARVMALAGKALAYSAEPLTVMGDGEIRPIRRTPGGE